MQTTRSHISILRVLQAAVDISTSVERAKTIEKEMSEEEREKWMKGRRKSLARLRERKTSRRGGDKWCPEESCDLGFSTEAVVVDVVPMDPVVKMDFTENPPPIAAEVDQRHRIAEKTVRNHRSNIDMKKLRFMARHGGGRD